MAFQGQPPKSPHPPDRHPGGTRYLDALADDLQHERAREDSLQQRGITVVTTAGTLVTLLFGLTSLTFKQGQTPLAGAARGPLILSLALFFLAAAAGLLTNATFIGWLYKSKFVDRITDFDVIRESWDVADDDVAKYISGLQFNRTLNARATNKRRALFVGAAIVCEVVAIGVLAFAIGRILW